MGLVSDVNVIRRIGQLVEETIHRDALPPPGPADLAKLHAYLRGCPHSIHLFANGGECVPIARMIGARTLP